MKDKNIWVAFIEAPQVWHERPISADEAKKDVALGLEAAFRGQVAGRLGRRRRCGQIVVLPPAGRIGRAHARGRRGRVSLPARSRSGDWCNCSRPGSRPPPAASPLLVYALDRSRATPLASFCPIDVLRSTLGVGPCQYILQTEGLAADANPTPDSVMTFVENAIQAGRGRRRRPTKSAIC